MRRTKALIPLVATSLLVLSSGPFAGILRADNESTDDTVGGATAIDIGSPSTPEPPATGTIPDGDVDYYVITNTPGFKKIRITYSFSGMGADTTRLRVLESDGTTEISNQVAGSTEFSVTYTILAQTGETYYLCVEGDSSMGTPDYSLTVLGTPDLNALTKVNREINKLKRQLKKAKKGKKSGRKVKKIKKKIKKLKKKKVKLLRA